MVHRSWYGRSLKSFQNGNLCDNPQNIAKPCARKNRDPTAFLSEICAEAIRKILHGILRVLKHQIHLLWQPKKLLAAGGEFSHLNQMGHCRSSSSSSSSSSRSSSSSSSSSSSCSSRSSSSSSNGNGNGNRKRGSSNRGSITVIVTIMTMGTKIIIIIKLPMISITAIIAFDLHQGHLAIIVIVEATPTSPNHFRDNSSGRSRSSSSKSKGKHDYVNDAASEKTRRRTTTATTASTVATVKPAKLWRICRNEVTAYKHGPKGS